MYRSMTVLMLSLSLCLSGLRADDDQKPLSNETFVKKASSGGMAEVQLGKLATTKGNMSEVKEFAQKMVDDHTKANNELARIAEAKNWTLEKQLDADHKKMVQKLSQLSGREFDKAYVTGQVKDHEDTVALFEKYVKEGSDGELRSFVSKTLPTIKHHLMMAQELDNKLKSSR